MAAVSGVFMAAGASLPAVNAIAGDVVFSISGSFVGSVDLEHSVSAAQTAWQRVVTFPSISSPLSGSFRGSATGVYRFRCASYTSGVIHYSLTPSVALLPATPATPGAFKPNAAMNAMAFGSLAITGATITDTTNNSMNTRRLCRAPFSTGLSDIVLGFAGWQATINLSETDIPTGYTATASIEYPIGATPTQVFFSGAPSATVAPGRTLVKSDPVSLYIPAGAAYAVKSFLTWTPGSFVLSSGLAGLLIGDWCNRGTGLSDNTLNNTVLAQTSGQGFSPLVFANPSVRVPVIGFLGDSITVGQQDQAEPVSQSYSWQRGLQGVIPSILMSIGGYSLVKYLSRMEGRNLVLRDSITHLVMSLGVNDINGGVSLATMQSNFQAVVAPFLARGVKVHAMTVTPNTNSTDGWLTYANQTAVSAGADTARIAYNNWLRTSWQSIGLSGVFDASLAVDPLQINKWANPDGAAAIVPSGQAAGLYSVLTGGAVSNIVYQTLSVLASGAQTVGGGYPVSTVIPWTTYPQLGDTGGGAFGTMASNSSGNMMGAVVVQSGGGGYTQPPMVNLASPLSTGLHPTVRGYNEMIYGTGFGPAAFSL